ncbi:MBL fold metallo-hydrolase [Novosphingobium mangrovi (ex Huang et al. 2023)]|uniref:MBL fold metallo-hydrolase n=1 Tax=Novosphingobium mangrovi (ex Huang et al. 2023) TaxID=2976432 RepID=A0ABT2I086_9SPHN|nr:MBL fold metallo-hydrolase [Novosphingobium mangrovi (ex Huang et al. 2023)]MCT2398212.1 MBL fold metallo-hydrolase [Novosphingobium mangrovi (ex Huang et al. 2023)]
MRPSLHPRLVNTRSGDAAVFVETLHRQEALLFDLGDLSPLSPRDVLRITHVFVTHMHLDHFVGFDRLLRAHIGRDKTIVLVGPDGFTAAVEHKLQAYTWDLVDRYVADLVFDVVEVRPDTDPEATRLRLKTGFARERTEPPPWSEGPVFHWEDFSVRVAILAHHGPSLGYAVQEPLHVNVWPNRLRERGLPTGHWLQPLKRAVAAGAADDTPIVLPNGKRCPLGDLRSLVSIERGQKIAYVTDVADTAGNRAAIAELARDADTFFIESTFSAADRDLALGRAHLSTTAAGEIARAAHARRVEPFHFSTRYEDEEDAMVAEVLAAFRGDSAEAALTSGKPAGKPRE